MNKDFKKYLARLEHRKFVRFTKNIAETLDEVSDLLFEGESDRAKEKVDALLHGWEMHWIDNYELLMPEKKKVYEQLAEEILAEIGIK